MASIITATTTNGLTHSADNSGVLQLASGVGNLVTVPSVTGTAMVSGNMPAFYATNSGNQSISAATYTKVTFDTEVFDTNNNFASSRFTPTVAGYYQISLGTYFGNGSADNIVTIYKNGSILIRGSGLFTGSSSGGSTYSMSALVYCNGSTDYIEFFAYNSAGTTVGNGFTWMTGCMMRGA